MNNIMLVAEYLSYFLKKRGVKRVFGYQGGSITSIIDAIYTNSIDYIQSYNEQGAAFSANSYAKSSDEQFGVAIASNGPGAINLLNGIANAYCDSIPVLFITGQVHTYAMKSNTDIRQESFQEIDIVSMAKTVTKYAKTILDANDIVGELERAYQVMLEGRKGPVLIDIPVDIQLKNIDMTKIDFGNINREVLGTYNINDMDVIYKRLKKSRRPIILCGGGVNSVNAKRNLKMLLDNLKIPVVCSLMGLDVLNHYNKCFFGFIGTYGNRYANCALQNADMIFVLGSRLDCRQIGKNKQKFAPDAFIVHIDIDKNELNHFINEDVSINCSVELFLKKFIEISQYIKKDYFDNWCKTLVKWKSICADETIENTFIKKISQKIEGRVAICSDVGQNQMWVAQSLRINSENVQMFNSGGLGAMGYSIPAAIGAYYSKKFDYVISFVGDGGFQMNLQELCSIGENQLPIVIIIMNNHSLGLIREIHEKYYDNRCCGSVIGFSQPNIEYISKAYNIKYIKINKLEEIIKLDKFKYIKKPLIIDMNFKSESFVTPVLNGLDTLDRQIPYISEKVQRDIQNDIEKLKTS